MPLGKEVKWQGRECQWERIAEIPWEKVIGVNVVNKAESTKGTEYQWERRVAGTYPGVEGGPMGESGTMQERRAETLVQMQHMQSQGQL